MSIANLTGTVGVALLLLAFFLNLFGFLGHNSRRYQLLNAAGAGLSCWASYAIGFLPFVVLEATWCAVAVVAMFGATRPH
jgi:hypothetical protein